MPNVQTIYQLECEAAYQREGVAKAMEFLKRYAPFFEHQGDGLTRTAIGDLTNVAQAIEAAAANLYAVVVVSPTAATVDAFVQIFNVAAASVTVGTTAPDLVLKVPFGKTVTYLVLPGDDDNDQFSAAISTAATTTPAGGTALAAASLPDVTFVTA